MSVSELACARCHSTYRITSMPVPVRRRDSIECQVCDAPLLTWTEPVEHYADLVTRREWRPPSGDPGPVAQGP